MSLNVLQSGFSNVVDTMNKNFDPPLLALTNLASIFRQGVPEVDFSSGSTSLPLQVLLVVECSFKASRKEASHLLLQIIVMTLRELYLA